MDYSLPKSTRIFADASQRGSTRILKNPRCEASVIIFSVIPAKAGTRAILN